MDESGPETGVRHGPDRRTDEGEDGDVDEENGGDVDEENGGDDPYVDHVEPGRPSAENVAFVLLGALGALYVLARVVGLV